VRRRANMREFAAEQVSSRLGRLVFQLRRNGKSLDADTVHDLRVAIRRFNQSLRIFGALLPRREAKKIRKRMRRLLDSAADVRDRDIALEFLKKAGLSDNTALWSRLTHERKQAEDALAEAIRTYGNKKSYSKWRSALQLGAQ
jgi:CHAD domain-containing protein